MMTIKDVAALAGVSKATVSRVINNNGYVNDETRQKVEQVIVKHNYSPSASAVNLSRRETNTIGVIVPEITNTFFGEMMHGIAEIVDSTDFSLIYCDTDNNVTKEQRALRMLEQQRVRGLVITPAGDYSEPIVARHLREMLERLNVPIVIVDRDFENSQWDGVFYENFQSAYCATTELIKAGNTQIGMLTGDLKLKIARDRYRGYFQAMEDNGLEAEERFIYKGDFSTPTAYSIAKEMFESKAFPKALVTSNNATSLGLLKAAKECRQKIGRDIAVIGIDHIPVLDILDYNFSYVSRNIVEMGRVAITLLLNRMKNPDAQRHIQMIPYELVLKGSEKMGE